MRQTIFRGKSIKSDRWYSGYLVQYHYGTYWIKRPDLPKIQIDPRTIGEYSGIDDIDGLMIFEGDRVKVSYGMGKVVFYCGAFMIEWIDDKEANMELLGVDKQGYRRNDLQLIK